jgi:hypothetical protein
MEFRQHVLWRVKIDPQRVGFMFGPGRRIAERIVHFAL